MALRTEQERAREHVRRMVGALSRDDLDDLQAVASRLVTTDGAVQELYHPALLEMATAIVDMVRAKAGPAETDTAFVIDLADERGKAVQIDALPPALRAFLRAVLAMLEKHPDDAAYQLNLVGSDPRSRGRLDALVHGLLCTNSLLEQGGAGGNAPPWLAGANA